MVLKFFHLVFNRYRSMENGFWKCVGSLCRQMCGKPVFIQICFFLLHHNHFLFLRI